jgi:hypothetical protein
MQLGGHDAMHASLRQLTWPELLILGVKLCRARRQAFQAALHAGSVSQSATRSHHAIACHKLRVWLELDLMLPA